MKYVQGVTGERDICGAVSVYVCVCSLSVLSSSVVRYGRKCTAIQWKIDNFEVLSVSLRSITIIFVVLYLGISLSCTDSPFPPPLPSIPLYTHRSCSHLYLLSSASCHITLRLNISAFRFDLLKIPEILQLTYYIVI